MLGGCIMSQDWSGVFRHVAPGFARTRAFRYLTESSDSSSTRAKHATTTDRAPFRFNC